MMTGDGDGSCGFAGCEASEINIWRNALALGDTSRGFEVSEVAKVFTDRTRSCLKRHLTPQLQ